MLDSCDRNPLMLSALNGHVQVGEGNMIGGFDWRNIEENPRFCRDSEPYSMYFQIISLILERKPANCSAKTLLHQLDINKVFPCLLDTCVSAT